MAMKFDNTGYRQHIVNSACLLLLALLSACTTTPETTQSNDAPIAAFIAEREAAAGAQQTQATQTLPTDEETTPLQLIDTLQYLPVQSYLETGEKIPYIAAVNPYERQSGVISKDSVQQFIQARRAFKAESFVETKQILQALIQQDATLSGPVLMLAKIEHQQGNIEAALTYYQQALTINPQNVNIYIGLAALQRQQGQFIEAQNTYANALTIWKDFPQAHANLAILYDVYLNTPDKAQAHMEASQFLFLGKNQQVNQWLAEIKQRTGVEKSYIDNPALINSEPMPASSS